MNEHVFSQRLMPAALGLLGLASWAPAQTLTHTFSGTAAYDKFGVAIAGGKDVSGDGIPDMAVGAPQDGNIFTPGLGYVRVISGVSGSQYALYQGDQMLDSFGAAVALAGDMNVPGDGRSEVIIGAPSASVSASQAGQVQVRSGLNGSVRFKINGNFSGDQLGFSVAAPGDVDGDGVPDFIAGAPFHSQTLSNGGLVRVYSGATGAVLYSFLGTANNGRAGWSVAGGDLNGDGRADIVVGSLFNGVRVYSGLNGALLYSLAGGAANDVFGRSVAVVSDLNGDNLLDLVVGATQDDLFSPGTGYARAFNGASGTTLWTVNGLNAGDRFGIAVRGAGFWDNDTRGDILVGASPQSTSSPGYVRILSGLNGSQLSILTSSSNSNGFGLAVAGLGDWNGNARTDIAIGLGNDSSVQVGMGRVEVYESPSQGCGVVSAYCSQATVNSTGNQALLNHAGSTSVAAANFILVCSQMPANQAGLAFYGASQASVPFNNGFRCVANPIFRLPPPVNSGVAGLVAISVPLANPPSPAPPIVGGSTWNFQVWYRDPAAGGSNSNTSTALQVTFCP
jgi:hypothetical protein